MAKTVTVLSGLLLLWFPIDVDELYFQVTGTIEDVETLKSLFELFAQTLKQLCRIGSACEDDPDMEL
jgi:hypothetical protein